MKKSHLQPSVLNVLQQTSLGRSVKKWEPPIP